MGDALVKDEQRRESHPVAPGAPAGGCLGEVTPAAPVVIGGAGAGGGIQVQTDLGGGGGPHVLPFLEDDLTAQGVIQALGEQSGGFLLGQARQVDAGDRDAGEDAVSIGHAVEGRQQGGQQGEECQPNDQGYHSLPKRRGKAGGWAGQGMHSGRMCTHYVLFYPIIRIKAVHTKGTKEAQSSQSVFIPFFVISLWSLC